MQGKRLFRKQDNRLIAGVASGVGAFVNLDPVLIRLGFVLLALFNGVGILIYLALWVLLPKEDTMAVSTREHVQENIDEIQRSATDFIGRLREAIEQFIDRLRGPVER